MKLYLIACLALSLSLFQCAGLEFGSRIPTAVPIESPTTRAQPSAVGPNSVVPTKSPMTRENETTRLETIPSPILNPRTPDTTQIPSTTWGYFFGNAEDVESASAIALTSDDGYVVAGGTTGYTNELGRYVYDEVALIFKLKWDGSLQWAHAYSGLESGWEKTYFTSIADDRGEGYLAGGSVLTPEGEFLPWIAKLDPDGNIVWQRTYPIPEAGQINSVALSNNGGYFVGVGQSRIDGRGAWLMELDSVGSVLWLRSLNDPEYVQLYSGAKTTSGFVNVGESTGNSGGGAVRIFLLEPTGSSWQGDYESRAAISGAIVSPLRDSGFLVSGYQIRNDFKAMAMRLNAEGHVLWSRSYDFYNVFAATSVLDGGYILAANDTNHKLVVVKLDTLGRFLWQKSIPFFGSVSLMDGANLGGVVASGDGGFALTANMVTGRANPVGNYQIVFLKFDKDGVISNCPIANPGFWKSTSLQVSAETAPLSRADMTLATGSSPIRAQAVQLPQSSACTP